MNCPNCGGKTYIIDTRPSEKFAHAIRRRRMCWNCRTKFTTYEVLYDTLEKTEKIRDLWDQIGEYMEEIK